MTVTIGIFIFISFIANNVLRRVLVIFDDVLGFDISNYTVLIAAFLAAVVAAAEFGTPGESTPTPQTFGATLKQACALTGVYIVMLAIFDAMAQGSNYYQFVFQNPAYLFALLSTWLFSFLAILLGTQFGFRYRSKVEKL